MPIFAGQITAPNPTIPGVLQNMFPMAPSQVYLPLFFSHSWLFYKFWLTLICLPVLLLQMQQFSALPMMPIQAMTQQVKKDFSVYTDFKHLIDL